MPLFVFPKWSNALLPALGVTAVAAPIYAILVAAYGFSPKTTDVGYMPQQPIPYSHELHAGELGIDCRYCHNTVEHAAKAAIPPTQTCMNCHSQIHKDSPKLEALRASFNTGLPVEWVRIHDLPDYAYFNHSAHVTRGVSCVSCHGRVDRMEVVLQEKTLSMGWCLECHRNPDMNIRDPKLVTQLDWAEGKTPAELLAIGQTFMDQNHLNPNQDCSTCHR